MARAKSKFSPEEGRLGIGHLVVSFQRAHADTGASLGQARFDRVTSFDGRAPAQWSRQNGIFVHVPDREVIWLGFSTGSGRYALHIRFNGEDAVSAPQNYVVCPPQLWLEGVYAGDRLIRRFRPEGENTAELQLAIYVLPASEVTSKRPAQEIRKQHSFATGDSGVVVPGVARDPIGLQEAQKLEEVCAWLIGPRQYTEITGRGPDPTPSPDDTYTGYPLP